MQTNKKLFVIFICLIFVSIVHADTFSPALLKITSEEIVPYAFDNSNLEIPVTVAGTPAQLVFLVYTKDKASAIGTVQNGYLGWHYVNKVDTCIYVSNPYEFDQGIHKVTWDGLDNDGGHVPPAEYTYYLWAFDNKSQKQKMSHYLYHGWGFDYTSNVQELDENGLPMANPIWYRADSRWLIGGDPMDESLLETTNILLPDGWDNNGDPLLHPTDFNYFYLSVGSGEERKRGIQKFKWIPGGEAEIQTDFGIDGLSETFTTSGGGTPGIATDRNYLFTGDENYVASTDPDADFYIYDFDGKMVAEIDLTEWWSSQEGLEAGGQMNGGPNNFMARHGKVFFNCHGSCLNQMVDPARYLESENPDDFFVWTNGNGDYFLDHNFEETAPLPWICHDYNVAPYKYSFSADDMLFSECGFYNDAMEVSFGLLGPDGTGIGYFAFQGQTNGWNKGSLFVDSGTPFDGIYCDNEQTGGIHYDWDRESVEEGIFFVAHDSIKGVITTAGSYLWLKSPYGGEIFGTGATHEIRWSSNEVDNVKLEYSADGGSMWNTIAESIAASQGSYSWAVPDIQSSQCLARITDTSDAGVSSTSKGVFTITPPYVSVTSPNGGELFEIGVSYNITWTYLGIETVTIEYSMDNGASWNIIAADVDASQRSCEWEIPDVVSSECLIRISEAHNPSVGDVSDGVFEISASFVDILSPDGGEELEGKTYHNINWKASSGVTNVLIELSEDNGNSWVEVATNIYAEIGFLKWRIPNTSSSLCRIRISSVDNPDITDISDNPFSIIPSTSLWTTYTVNDGIGDNHTWVVTDDHLGGVWVGTGEEWSGVGGISHFNGFSWTNYSTGNSGISADNVYALVVDHEGIVWVGTTWNGLCRFDGNSWKSYTTNNSPLPDNDIRDLVVDHNNILWITMWHGGLASFDGTNWKSYSSVSHGEILAVDVDNSIWVGYNWADGGVSHYRGESMKRYYKRDGLAGDLVLGIAIDQSGKKWFATSGGVTTFDGETWYSYSHLIGKHVQAVAIDFDDVKWFGYNGGVSSFNGLEWSDYTTRNSDLSNGNIWRIAVDNNNVKWFATRDGGVISFDYHTGPNVRITSPDGGEIWETGSAYNIDWWSRDVENVNLEYSADSGSTWNAIAQSVDTSPGFYLWTLPDIESHKCMVRITDSSNSAVIDVSNDVFTISSPFVLVTSPNGGERWSSGTTHDITWKSVGVDMVNIKYSSDNGATWEIISGNFEASTGSVSWLIPGIESESYLVHITDTTDAERSDTSDGVFTVTHPFITVIFPNGGEVLTNEQHPVITWDSDGVEKVNIEYSVDSGATWNPIVNNIDTSSHSFTWKPYPVQSMLCFIRITDSSDSGLWDESDSIFTYLVEVSVDSVIPEEFAVFQNSPNPFNPSTTITFNIPQADHVTLEIFNLSGQRVAVPVKGYLNAGRYTVNWNASGLSAGVYIYRVRAGADSRTKKMLLMK